MNNKSVFRICAHLFSFVVLVFLLSSCGPPSEKAHPAYKRGVNLMNKGEYKEAAESFEKYLTFNYNSSLTHYKLAELYNDYLDDSFLAVYHFRYYLKLEPDASDRDVIVTWIEAAEEKMVKKIRERNPDLVSEEEILKLKQNNTRFRDLLIRLKKQNAAFRKKLNSGTLVSFNGKTKNNSKSEKKALVSGNPSSFVIETVYKVKSGDSLSKISREVYGSSKYYKLIFEANKDILESEAKLSIGQELRIPKLENSQDEVKKNNITTPDEDGYFPGVITD